MEWLEKYSGYINIERMTEEVYQVLKLVLRERNGTNMHICTHAISVDW